MKNFTVKQNKLLEKDVQGIIKKENLSRPTIVVVPRSKTEKKD